MCNHCNAPVIDILDHGTVLKEARVEVDLVHPTYYRGQKLTSIVNELKYSYEYLICKNTHRESYNTCYIRIPECSIYKNALNCKIKRPEFFDKYASVYGGFSYMSKHHSPITSSSINDGLWIGWDYFDFFDKKYDYSIEELKNEVMDAIDQLFESERRMF